MYVFLSQQLGCLLRKPAFSKKCENTVSDTLHQCVYIWRGTHRFLSGSRFSPEANITIDNFERKGKMCFEPPLLFLRKGPIRAV